MTDNDARRAVPDRSKHRGHVRVGRVAGHRYIQDRSAGDQGATSIQANITLPVGVIVVDVLERLALLATKRVKRDVPRVGAIAAIVFAKNVEMVEVFVTPLET